MKKYLAILLLCATAAAQTPADLIPHPTALASVAFVHAATSVVRPPSIPLAPMQFACGCGSTDTLTAGTVWHAGNRPGEAVFTEQDGPVNSHQFTNVFDARLPWFAWKENYFIMGQSGFSKLGDHMVYQTFQCPLVMGPQVLNFVYKRDNCMHYAIWGAQGINYTIYSTGDMLQPFKPMRSFTGSNAIYTVKEPMHTPANLFFYAMTNE